MNDYHNLLYVRNIIELYYNNLNKMMAELNWKNRVLIGEKERDKEILEYVPDYKQLTEGIKEITSFNKLLSNLLSLTGLVSFFTINKIFGASFMMGSYLLFSSVNLFLKNLNNSVINSKVKKSEKKNKYYSNIEINSNSIKECQELLNALKDLMNKIDEKLIELCPTNEEVIQSESIDFEERANQKLANNDILMKKLNKNIEL